MNFVFVHSGVVFDGSSLAKGPLGGTETALIGVTRELAKNPEDRVFVFTNVPGEGGEFDGVSYRRLDALKSWADGGGTADVLVSIRHWLPLALPLRARLRVYFSPDAWDQPFLRRAFDAQIRIRGENVAVPFFAPDDFLSNVDRIFCVGRWQADTFVSALNLPREKIFVTANAHFPENFRPRPLGERRPDLVYSATPFRGLAHLSRYYPEIKRLRPGTGLEVPSGMGVYGMLPDEERKSYGALFDALKAAGAVCRGSVRQDELAALLCRSRVYAYPNTFEETFCISVLEAQAAGLPVVTSAKGALPERVSDGVDGFLVTGSPGEADYDRDFIRATLRLLEDDALWDAMSLAAVKKAASFTYDRLAASWRDFFARESSSRREPALPIPVAAFHAEERKVPHPLRPATTLKFDGKILRHLLNEAFRAHGFTFP